MRTTFTRAMLAGAVAALALSACDRATMDKADREGAEIGKKTSDVLSRTEAGLRDAGRRARDTLADATKPAPASDAHDAAHPAESRDAAPKDTASARRAPVTLPSAALRFVTPASPRGSCGPGARP